jgi:type IV secretion system protein VirB9
VEEDLQNALQSEQRNYQYSVEGNDEISPYEAWDDGTFTYMRFYAQQDFPAAFYIDEESQEALVNLHFEDDVMVIHRVANKFILRRGNIAACLTNERRIFYTPYWQNATTTKEVERTLKEPPAKKPKVAPQQ